MQSAMPNAATPGVAPEAPSGLSALGSALSGNFAPAGEYFSSQYDKFTTNPLEYAAGPAINAGLSLSPASPVTGIANLGMLGLHQLDPSIPSSIGEGLANVGSAIASGQGVGVSNAASAAGGAGSGTGSPTDYLTSIGAGDQTLGEIYPATNTLNTSAATATPTPPTAAPTPPTATPTPTIAATPAVATPSTASSSVTKAGGPTLGGYPDTSTYLNAIGASFNRPRYI